MYAIDQYVLSGRSAIIYVDPFLEVQMGGGVSSSDLAPLFAAWGVDFDAQKIVADRQVSMLLPNSAGSGNVSRLNWLALTGELVNKQDLVTADINTLYLVSAGHIAAANEELDLQPLMQTTENSALVDTFSAFDPKTLLQNFVSMGEPLNLAVRIAGNLTSGFADRDGQEGHISSTDSANLLLFADVDMLRDELWLQRQNFFGQTITRTLSDNVAMLVNAIEKMQGNTDLISLRSRKVPSYPFHLVQDLQRDAEAKFLAKEQELTARLTQLQSKIDKVTQDNGQLFLAASNKKVLSQFNAQLAQTRKELRRVQHSLNADIENLGTLIKFLNVILLPILIILLSLVVPRYLGIKN